MNYFIDFEATQYSNEIISIGCVNERGDKFSSLVQANPKKVTNFITELTGITKQDVINAPSADEVFNNFYDWITIDGNIDFTFYCYGDTDITFIESNLKKAKNLKAICALSIIGMHLKDYSKIVKEHYGLIKNIKLIKLVQYYRGVDHIEQAHDALEDALYLKEIFDNIQKEGSNVKNPFPDYAEEIKPVKNSVITTDFTEPKDPIAHISIFKQGKYHKSFYSWKEAAEFIIAQEQSKCEHKINLTNRRFKSFILAIQEGVINNYKPWGYRWRIHGNVPKERK
jgi:DNA polymerase III epsilon subunit-like protein